MGIGFVMSSISAEAYDQLTEGGGNPEAAALAHRTDESVTDWGLMYHLLADGQLGNPPQVTKAITGDVLVADESLPHEPPYGVIPGVHVHDGDEIASASPGLGALCPELVVQIASDLATITDEEIAERYARLDASVTYRLGYAEPETVTDQLHHLQAFYQAAADASEAIVVWLG